MTLCGSPASLSHSDYGTGSNASSSDEESARSIVPVMHRTAQPGLCPHCSRTYQEPLSLPCGHSFCSDCVAALLDQQSSTGGLRRKRIRMGLSGYKHRTADLRRPDRNSETHRKVEKSAPSTSVTHYRSPQCIVCSDRPRMVAPMVNYDLQLLLESIASRPSEQPTAYRNEKRHKTEHFDTDDERSFFTRDCRIAVLGGSGVGKTSLRRVQNLNEFMFTDVLGKGVDDTYVIDIADGNNSDQDILSADGFVLMYSITDRESFRVVSEIFAAVMERRFIKVPLVLVGGKSDSHRHRRVESFEGQRLARQLQCPFIEVSAMRNDNVNEAFVELMRVVERQRLL